MRQNVSKCLKARQNVSKCLKARQMCVDDDDDECNLEKTSFINCTEHPVMHRTQIHKLGVSFSYIERKKAFPRQQSSLAFLGCGFVRVLFSRCFRGNLKTRFHILFESLSSINYSVKQFGLSDATERLSLFRLWLCENFKTLFQILQVFRLSLNLTASRSSEAFETAHQF